MPSLNFKPQFVDAILNGTKSQTIRRRRKRPIYRYDFLYPFTGMRTKSCRKLGEATCTETIDIRLTEVNHRILTATKPQDDTEWEIPIAAELKEIFQRDGFPDLGAMHYWFEQHQGYPFEGQVIRWDPEDLRDE